MSVCYNVSFMLYLCSVAGKLGWFDMCLMIADKDELRPEWSPANDDGNCNAKLKLLSFRLTVVSLAEVSTLTILIDRAFREVR